MTLECYTDGSCSGNPGPGAWAYLIRAPDKSEWHTSGFSHETTNNQMEMLAILKCLEHIAEAFPPFDFDIFIHTDSLNCIGWLTGNFKCRVNKLIEIRDQIKTCIEFNKFTVSYVHVKGHNGHPDNEFVNKLAQDTVKNERH